MSANLSFGIYFIRSAPSGTVINVRGAGRILVGSALDYDQAGTQLFEFKRFQDRFIITNIETKLVVDMSGGSASPRTPVISCEYHGGHNQQWHIQPHGGDNSNYHLITNSQSGTSMDLAGGNLENGTEIFGYETHRDLNQQWEFIGVTEHMLGRQIEIPGPERVIEKIIPGPERVVEKVVEKVIPGPERVIEKIVLGPERVVERVVERMVPGPERVVEKIVVNFHDSPETLREMRELRAQILRALEGQEIIPKVSGERLGEGGHV